MAVVGNVCGQCLLEVCLFFPLDLLYDRAPSLSFLPATVKTCMCEGAH